MTTQSTSSIALFHPMGEIVRNHQGCRTGKSFRYLISSSFCLSNEPVGTASTIPRTSRYCSKGAVTTVNVEFSTLPAQDEPVEVMYPTTCSMPVLSKNHGYLILFKSEIATNDRFVGTLAVEEILRRFPPQSRSGGTALYDAIIHAAKEQLSSTKIPRNSRRAIFILSDGGDNTSHKSLEQTLKLVRNDAIPIFSIGF